jgi:G protein beta subunit-like protein
LATGNDRGELELWLNAPPWPQGPSVSKVKLTKDPIRSIVAVDDQKLAVASIDGRIAIVSVTNGEEPPMVERIGEIEAHEKPTCRLAVSPCGSMLVSASADSTAKVWSLADLKLKTTLAGQNQTKWVWDAVWRDGGTVITAGTDRSARVWEVGSGSILHVYTHHPKGVTAIALHFLG